ncbi:hypothetical protein B0H11DRAFT_2199426, partial [Mycena galericulata]
MSAPIGTNLGRPKGSKNQPDHRAGGTRMGAGRPLGATGQASGSGLVRADSEPVRQLGASETRSRRPITGNGIANLAPMFMPRSTKVHSNAENSAGDQSNSGANMPSAVPFPFLPPESAQGDSDDDSETDSDFEDLLDEAIPSKPLLDEANVSAEGVISLYLTGIKRRLIAEMASGAWPKCYDEGSFWIHPPAPIFSLQKSLDPTGLYYPSVFVWFPHLIGTTLTCPNKDCLHFKSLLRELKIKGYNDKPLARRVVALDHVYYVMTNQVHCRLDNGGCGRSWNLYDPLILDQLDRGLAECFPSFLTARSGIDKTLMTLIRAGIAHRMSASAWSKILRELHVREHDLRELQYLYAIHRKKKIDATLGIAEQSFEPFSVFDDKSKYAGFYPSRWYINNVYMDYMQHIRPILDQCMAALTAFMIKWDHSFKVSKYLMKLN